MVHYQRSHQWMKKGGGENEEDEPHHPLGLVCGNMSYYYNFKRAKPKLLYLLFLSLVSCCFVLAPQILNSLGFEGEVLAHETDSKASLCSSVSNGTMCCDRSSFRSDVCVMKGDIRTDSASSKITLYTTNDINEAILSHVKIKPYTRKWETSVMDTIDELELVIEKKKQKKRECDVSHDVPAVFFSTGGYTGNLYHEFNDGILPLYITSHHFNKRVVFVILEYHNWWITKYGNILSQLSDFPPIDFRDNKTHCFPEAIVGLRIHDELTVDSSLMEGNKNIRDFRELLDRAYWPRIRGLIQDEEREARGKIGKPQPSASSPPLLQNVVAPKLVIIARNGSRTVTNEGPLVELGEEIGFRVEVLRPARTSELAKVYRLLNSSDVMVGVHGAAMTHFLFLRPKSVFIQIIPLGTDWAAETYYGEPAKRLGLKYIGYKILPRESSLFDEYDENDPVLRDPAAVNRRGWEVTKRIYLEHQNVRLNLARFRRRLVYAYYHSITNQMKGQIGLLQIQ